MGASCCSRYTAELIGTFALVFVGCGSAVIAGGHIGFLGIAFAFGLTVLAMVYAIGNISGCHINPAITIAMLGAGKMNAKDAIAYIISQCIGGILGAGVLYLIASGLPGYSLADVGLGQNGYGSHSPLGYSLMSCFIAEVVLTTIFILVIFGSTSKNAPSGFAGIPIGLSLVLIHLVGIPITGTSVNPARSLGPAVFAGSEALSQLWLFWVAPILGSVVSVIMWKCLLNKRDELAT
jgi:aquaporin Z